MAATDFVTEAGLQNALIAVATDVSAVSGRVNGDAANLDALTTTDKSSLVAAINEHETQINALSGGGSAEALSDLTDVTLTSPANGNLLQHNGTAWVNVAGTTYATPSDLATLEGSVEAMVADLVDSAPGTLDTLNELAAALGDDPNFATTTATALGNRLRIDAAQGLSSPQQAQGRANLGIVASTEDFAAGYVALRS